MSSKSPGPAAPFATVEEAIEEFRAGRIVILVDDEDRENEGDLAIAAEAVTPETVNFMARYGRGLICLAHDRGALRRARAAADGARQHLAVRHRLHGVDRGAAARSRPASRRPTAPPPSAPRSTPRPARTTCCAPATSSRCARGAAACCKRAGQTEASVDLARLAGLTPAAAICEIMNDDGTMARVPDLVEFAARARPQDPHRRRPDPPPAAPPSAWSSASPRRRLPTACGEFRAARLPGRGDRRGAPGAGRGRRSPATSRCWCASTASA